MSTPWPLLALGVVAALAAPAYAHKPILIGSCDCTRPDTALTIDDISVSQVAYYDLADSTKPLWLTFNATAGQGLYIQLGVPKIDRLASFRPAVALIGPGLPTVELPFVVPAGLGAVVFDSVGVQEPQVFHEPFTGTDSWILLEEQTTLPADGQYYLVAYGPGGQTGKLWVAVGQKEEFGLSDFAAFGDIVSQVRAFHETSASGPPCILCPAGLVFAAALLWRLTRSTAPRIRPGDEPLQRA